MAIALREGRSVRDEEIIVARPDGTRRNVMPYPEPIRDTGGKIVGIVVMLLDITERKSADAAVRQLAAIVESSDDAIVGKDLNGIITSWNRGAEILFGYTAGQMIGQSVQRLIPPEQKDEESGILERLRRGEPIRYDETIRRRQDGTLVDVSLSISPIKDAGGRIVGASKIARDISERKRSQHQANFLSQLSHQLSSLSDPDAIIRAASRAVGLQLNTDRCYFCTLSEEVTRITVSEDWAKEGFGSASGVHQASDFGTPELWHAMAIDSLAIDNKVTHPLTRNLGAGYDRLRISAHASVPFHRKGEWIASLAVTSEKSRVWRKDELALLENTIVRVWPMVERARSQRDLQESERRQRELMQSLPIACYTIDSQGRLTFFNAAAVRLWGREPELKKTLWCGSATMVTLDGGPLAIEDSPVAIALRGKRPVRGIEAFVVRPDGTRRWVAPHPDPIFDAQGNCTGVVDVVLDVTEERTAHGKIQNVAEHLSLAIASANLGDWNWDAATDIITLSPRTIEIYGIPSSANLTRSHMREVLHENDRERSRLALQHAIETRTDYDIEYRVVRPDGTQRWVAAKGRSFYHSNGQVLGMVGVVQDITERKSQVEELKNLSREIKIQAQLFDATLSNIADLAYAFDLKGRWIYANRPLLDLWNRSFEEIVGKTCSELGYPPELTTRLEAQIREVIATKCAVRGETPYVSASGKIDDHEYIFSPVMDASGKVTAVVGTTRLITERKQAENALKRARDEAMAASRAKDDFLAALSHELRTPLNPVLLLASAAAVNPDLPPAIREDFDLIRKNVDLEARLIDDLLDLTRITRGKLQLDQRRCDLHAILKDALANVQADLLEKRIVLVTNFDAVDRDVWGDSVRLQQILWNILKNAVKFTPEGGNIKVTTSSSAQKATIQISDSGIGMSQDEIARAFQAFSQGEHAVTGSQLHRFGGLGLGLAISKMLVELHAGQIRASSAGRNQGSTFVIELPLLQGTAGDRAEPRRAKTGLRANSLNPFIPSGTRSPIPVPVTQRRILLVEDHAPTLLTLQQLLKCRQFEVTTAKSAAEAHKHALAGEFDLVISDVGLPDRTGYELMTDLRTMRPMLPGIALSGYGMEEDLTRSRAAGFSVHLVKPVTISVLEEAIAYLLPSSTEGRPSQRNGV
jgi:PAS domain S-box-containing protein